MSFRFYKTISVLAIITAHLYCANAYTEVATPRLPAIPYDISIKNAPSSAFIIQDGTISITAQKGTDLFTDTEGKTHADNTPRILFQPAGDFILSAKVTAALTNAYDGGALIVYADDHHWAKLLFERFEAGHNGVATTVTSTTGDDAYHGTRTSESQYLKIARRGNSYIFYSSPDGKQWVFLRHFALNADAPIKVGFSAQAPIGDSLKVEFSELNYSSSTITDFWQGK